jgi:hypothetical protein
MQADSRTHEIILGRGWARHNGWNALYRDPNDCRYWELTYPEGELHGGGPPQLRCLTADEARQKPLPVQPPRFLATTGFLTVLPLALAI